MALVLGAAFAAGCGGGGGDDTPDAAVDSSIRIPDSSRPVDAAVVRGTKGTLEACATDNECLAGFDCLALSTGSFCMRQCNGRGTAPMNDCDPGFACVQNGAPTLSAAFKQLENHCFISFCGPDRGNGTGTLESTCELGKELWAAGTTGFTPGFCLPFDDGDGTATNPATGLCQPIGNIALGGACPRTGAVGEAQCSMGTICIGPGTPPGQTPVPGTCAEICNPTALATNGCATATKFCQDSSEKDTEMGGRIAIGTYGFCVDNQTCNVLEAGTAPATGGMTADQYNGCMGVMVMGNAVTCFPTTSARPNGLCGARVGTAAVNTACANVANPMPAQLCTDGNTCGDDTAGAADMCRKYCRLDPATGAPTGTPDCAGLAGTTCKAYVWTNGTNPANNENAVGFGLCKP